MDVRAEVFHEMYEKPIYPPNLFPAGKPPRSLTEKINGAKTALDSLYARGHFTLPDGYEADKMGDALQERVDQAHKQGTLLKLD